MTAGGLFLFSQVERWLSGGSPRVYFKDRPRHCIEDREKRNLRGVRFTRIFIWEKYPVQWKPSLKMVAPIAALLVATMVAPAAFAAGGNGGGGGNVGGGAGGNVQSPPAVVVSTLPCARASLSTPASKLKLGLISAIPYDVAVQNCSSSTANLDVSVTLVGVSASSLGCTVPAAVAHVLNLRGGQGTTISLSGAVPHCLGQYVGVVLVSRDGKLLQGSSNLVSIKLI